MLQKHLRKTLTLTVVVSALAICGSQLRADTIKIGASAPKTGPLAGGSTVSFWPNVELWVKQINAAGGIKLKSGRAKIELVEYDDRTNPGEAIKNIQRLATQDKVDFILAPYGTGLNLATAPLFAKFNYLIHNTLRPLSFLVITSKFFKKFTSRTFWPAWSFFWSLFMTRVIKVHRLRFRLNKILVKTVIVNNFSK